MSLISKSERHNSNKVVKTEELLYVSHDLTSSANKMKKWKTGCLR